MRGNLVIVFLLLIVGCNYPTPKMACEDELESDYKFCMGNLAFYVRRQNSSNELIAIVACADYIKKKDKCDKKLY